MTTESTKSRGDLQLSVTASQTMTDCEFWRLITILPSVDDEESQTRSFYRFTLYHLLDVEFLLVREHEIQKRAVGHLLENFPAFVGAYSHMIGHKLLAIQHLEGLHLQIVPQYLVHSGFSHTDCGGQGSAASARVSSQLFPRVFEELRGPDTPFASTPLSVKGVSSLLELVHDLPHR